ncbi:MAG: NAD-dependent DNA ligase LigA [Rickettsia sp.]|nr:NAD-dependent DNA ligase LigA [Rickettsia sp.]
MSLFRKKLDLLKNTPIEKIKEFLLSVKIDEAKILIKHLSRAIIYHNELYFNQNEAIISDFEYDKFFYALTILEKQFPQYVVKNSPTQNVGSHINTENSLSKKFVHKQAMFSLNNTYTESEVKDFLSRICNFLNLQGFKKIFCEPKIDGLSFSATYKSGILEAVSTRGDGYEGELVTENMKTLKDFPTKISTNIKHLEVRGEVYLNKEDFITLNQNNRANGIKIFSNPRNAAVGSLRQLNPEITKIRNLKYFVYATGYSSEIFANTQEVLLKKMKRLGFCVNHIGILANSFEEMMAFYDDLLKKREKLPYQIDGIVYKINDFDLQKRLDFVNRRPRFAIAHKFPENILETKILDIELNVGRTGSINPLARFEPVNIGGVIIKKASLHNFVDLIKKDVRLEDFIYIKRAGDVIPYIISVNIKKRTSNSKKYNIPTKCPSCKNDLLWEKENKILRCINILSCPAQKLESLIYFAHNMDIQGLGKKQVEFFFNEGFIKNLSDIFLLEENLEKNNVKLLELERWGEQSIKNLFNNINKAKEVSLEKFIRSIGIRYLGEVNSRILATECKNIKNFLDFLKIPSNIQAINLDGFGEKIISFIKKFAQQSENLTEIEKLAKILTIKDYIIENTSNIAGKKIVFSGELENYSRYEIKNKAISLGAKIQSQISSKTDFLVIGKNPGSKLRKAQELSVKILTESQWNFLLK